MKAEPRETPIGRNYAGRRAELMNAPRSDLPEAPCFRCGARGWCEHRRPG